MWMHVDAELIVVHKPAGLLAVPGKGESGRDNLASRVQAVYADALVVHRLDQATSGLMVLARGLAAQRSLSRAFEMRQVDKTYVAIVEGEIKASSGTIDLPLAADWPQRPRQKVDTEYGRPALTHWQRLSGAAPAGCTRLQMQPVTGRTHQLRIHLAHIGHPICGDGLYAPEPRRGERMLLHASSLQLPHPGSGVLQMWCSVAPF